MKIDKTKLRDSRGHPLTQSLFLEIDYNSEAAIYTLKDDDHTLNGKTYLSLKRLYLECEDPTEYDFAKKYLLGWSHWKRLQENKTIRKHIDEWREELEYQIRSQAVRDIITMSANETGGFKLLNGSLTVAGINELLVDLLRKKKNLKTILTLVLKRTLSLTLNG